MTRRILLSVLSGAAVDRLLWVPKLISIPPVRKLRRIFPPLVPMSQKEIDELWWSLGYHEWGRVSEMQLERRKRQ